MLSTPIAPPNLCALLPVNIRLVLGNSCNCKKMASIKIMHSKTYPSLLN